MLLTILLVILVIDCVALVGVVLLQRSEGGALGMGGGPTGMFTARGAGDLLTRTTWILATVFFVLSFLITMLSSFDRLNASVVNRINPNDLQVTPQAPLPGAPGEAPAQSGAPPLPSAAPPLPGTAPAPATTAPPLPQSAPRPTAAPRPAAQRRTAPQPTAAPPPAARTQPATPAPTATPPPPPAPATTTPTPNQ